jgi:hypothetical protein
MEIVLVIGAILVAWLVFTWLFKVIKVQDLKQFYNHSLYSAKY